MRKDSGRVAALRIQGDIFSDTSDKETILNKQFSFVYPQEPIGSMPEKTLLSFYAPN